jgi:DNA repair exonuclease SbcCD nuclease subunit
MTEGSEATLNLTAEKAKRLLAKTDYVFLGHEHQPRQALDGRVVILGNTHPTSFGDISDKYYWTLTPDSLEKTLCWEAEAHFVEADINSTDALFPAGKDIQFVDVVGAVTADNGAEVARFIHDIWETVKPLMVRNSVSIVASNHATAEVVDVADLPAQIGKQLKGTNLEATYNYYWGKI